MLIFRGTPDFSTLIRGTLNARCKYIRPLHSAQYKIEKWTQADAERSSELGIETTGHILFDSLHLSSIISQTLNAILITISTGVLVEQRNIEFTPFLGVFTTRIYRFKRQLKKNSFFHQSPNKTAVFSDHFSGGRAGPGRGGSFFGQN